MIGQWFPDEFFLAELKKWNWWNSASQLSNYGMRGKKLGLNFRIPGNLLASHWIRKATIVIFLVLQSTPTHVNGVDCLVQSVVTPLNFSCYSQEKPGIFDPPQGYTPLMRSTCGIETMVLPELSRRMAYTTRNTVNRLARKELDLNPVVPERSKEK